MENIFLEKFHKISFTKRQEKIAQYCIDNQLQVSQKTLRQFAEEAGVSEVSVLNFVRKLDFDGFSEFRKWAFNQVAGQAELENTEQQRSLSERLEKGRETRYQGTLLQNHMKKITYNIESSLMQNKQETYEQIAKRLLSSKRIYVMGTRSASGAAERLALGLQYLLNDVVYIDDLHRGMMQTLSRGKKGDTLVLICLSRYYKTDAAICKMAKDKGIHLVLLSDSSISPIAFYADDLLLVNIDSGSFHHSEMGLIAITEYLTALLTEQQGDLAKESWDFIDEHMKEFLL